MTTKNGQSKASSGDFEEYVIDSLKDDPRLASAYLNAAIADGDISVFLLALGQITKARGMSSVSKATGLNRENIYRIVSDKGNPRFTNLQAILGAVGLTLRTEPLKKRPVKKAA